MQLPTWHLYLYLKIWTPDLPPRPNLIPQSCPSLLKAVWFFQLLRLKDEKFGVILVVLSLITTSSPSANPVGSIFQILFIQNLVVFYHLHCHCRGLDHHTLAWISAVTPHWSPHFLPCPTKAGLNQQQSEPIKNRSRFCHSRSTILQPLPILLIIKAKNLTVAHRPWVVWLYLSLPYCSLYTASPPSQFRAFALVAPA